MPDVVLRMLKNSKEPDVQKKIAEMLKNIVDGFVQSLGPMASIVQGFNDIETIERGRRGIFIEKRRTICQIG